MATIDLNVLYQYHPGDPSRLTSHSSECKSSWSVCVDPVTGSHDELFICGKTVVWSKGLNPSSRVIKISYSVDTEVLQAIWCQFVEDRDKKDFGESVDGDDGTLRCVCVREQDCLTLFVHTGAVCYTPLPFQVCNVWAIPGGLLIERDIPRDGGYEGLPTLFTLLHPSDDLCPVTSRRPAEASDDVTVLGFFSDPQQRVLGVCTEGETLVICCNLSSRQHSIWAVQRATQNDIPAHLTTPLKPGSGLSTPQHPLSSSAPSCYGNGHMTTPTCTLMDTPVEMFLSSTRPGNGQEHHQLPLLTQLQRRGVLGHSTAKHDGGSGVKGHGRSPFISRLQTPHHHQGSTRQTNKRSKSLSPLAHARISPFSQAINSRSWSTFYSDEFSFGKNFEPLIPQVCLRRLWREPVGGMTSSTTSVSMVTSIHKTSDFIGNKYILLLLPCQQQLWLLGYRKGEPLSFGGLKTLSAVQVVPIKAHPMFVLLEVSGSLSLYSGHCKVATINTLPLFSQTSSIDISADNIVAMETSSLTSVCEIRDSLGEEFTVGLESGEMFRCSITQPFRQPTVTLCLRALKEMLPADLALNLLANYYNSSHTLPPSQLVKHFQQWLLACLGLVNEDRSAGQGGALSQSPWQHVQAAVCIENMTGSVPALEMFLTTARKSPEAPPDITSSCCLQSHTQTVLLALHLVYEELKLSTVHRNDLPQLAELLIRISSCLGQTAYIDHYWRDFPHIFPVSMVIVSKSRDENAAMDESSTPHTPHTPPHIFYWLTQTVRHKPVDPFPVLPSVCVRTATIIQLYSLYCSVTNMDTTSIVLGSQLEDDRRFKKLQEMSSLPWEQVVLCLAEKALGPSDLETLPVGVALPLWDSISKCVENPPSTWPQAAYDIIGRRDVSESLRMRLDTSHLKMEDPKECNDGMNMNQEILCLSFPNDLRVSEVRRFLQSSNPVRIALTQKPEVSDHEFLEQQETHLILMCQRTMALPVGRGIFTLCSAQPLPTAPLAIPKLHLGGRVPPKNSAVGLDHIDKPVNMNVWAEFHNGVAAGLKIAPGISQLDRAWIVYNRPMAEDSANEYAGFLMALGLNGHLTSVPHYDLYNLLKGKHELTVIGLLLGITVARAGSVSLPLTSLLSIYFPPLLPHGSADMEVPSSIQTAAMMGLGHLYMGSANRHMTEMMLRELGRTKGPEFEFADNRESYSLTAGLALGMITLGLGSSPLGLSDLHLVDQLCVLMNGGPKREVAQPRNVGEGHLVLEGDQVNTHVTAPGAILALSLMYLKTNDSTVAATLDVPSTQYELDCIRPDFLLLRALSRCLIMWDSVEPDIDWIKANHLPNIVSEHAFQGGKVTSLENIDYQSLSQAYVNIIAGCCLGIGLRYAGTCDNRAKNCLFVCAKELLSKLESSGVEQTGKPCMEKCVVTVVLAMAVVMSGSGDLDVLRMIRRLRLSHFEMCYGSHMTVHMSLGLLFIGGGRYSLNRSNESIVALVCSLYPMFPLSSTDNRYHLQAFRHFYVLAAEPRLLVTREIKTSKTCSVDVEILSDGSVKRTLTPCIVPEWTTIEKISVCSSSYWPMTFDLTSGQHSNLRQNLPKSRCIFVKQRAAHRQIDLSMSELSGEFSVKMLCQQLALPGMQKNSPCSKFLVASLLQHVHEEKLQILSSFLQLEQCTLKASQLSDGFTSQYLWQVKLAEALGHHGDSTSSHGYRHKSVISCELTDGLLMKLKNSLDELSLNTCGSVKKFNGMLCLYLSSDDVTMAMHLSQEESRLLVLTLALYDIPSPCLLKLPSQTSVCALCDKLDNLHLPMTTVVRLLTLMTTTQS